MLHGVRNLPPKQSKTVLHWKMETTILLMLRYPQPRLADVFSSLFTPNMIKGDLMVMEGREVYENRQDSWSNIHLSQQQPWLHTWKCKTHIWQSYFLPPILPSLPAAPRKPMTMNLVWEIPSWIIFYILLHILIYLWTLPLWDRTKHSFERKLKPTFWRQ